MRALYVITAVLWMPTMAWAASHDLSGHWSLPRSAQATIEQNRSGEAKAVVQIMRGKRSIRLVITGEVSYVKLGTDGGLGFTGQGESFSIRWHGKRCVVKDPRLAVLGELVDDNESRRYHADGALHGDVYCRGKNTGKRWVADLSGSWQ